MAEQRGVTVVWTDYGGVLTPPLSEAFETICGACGVPAEALVEAMRTVSTAHGFDSLLEPLERGAVTERAWGRQLTDALAPRWTPQVDLGRFGEYWYAGRTPNTALLDWLSRAKLQGLRIGLLTNSIREWEPLRARLTPDTGLYDAVINSHEIGIRKPEAAIYELAETTLDATGASVVFIDDSAANCAAAQARGWHAVHHGADDAATARTITALRDLTGVA